MSLEPIGISSLNKRYDRFPSVGDHIHAATTFEYVWATPGHTIIEGS